MAMQTTRWSPDTCKCVVEYQWDDTLSQEARIHTITNIVNQCVDHVGNTAQQANIILFDENPRKNKFLEKLRSTFSGLTTTDSQGNVVLKNGVVTWSFDASRVLQIIVPSLTTAQKSTAQSWADTNLGIGKVKVS